MVSNPPPSATRHLYTTTRRQPPCASNQPCLLTGCHPLCLRSRRPGLRQGNATAPAFLVAPRNRPAVLPHPRRYSQYAPPPHPPPPAVPGAALHLSVPYDHKMWKHLKLFCPSREKRNAWALAQVVRLLLNEGHSLELPCCHVRHLHTWPDVLASLAMWCGCETAADLEMAADVAGSSWMGATGLRTSHPDFPSDPLLARRMNAVGWN